MPLGPFRLTPPSDALCSSASPFFPLDRSFVSSTPFLRLYFEHAFLSLFLSTSEVCPLSCGLSSSDGGDYRRSQVRHGSIQMPNFQPSLLFRLLPRLLSPSLLPATLSLLPTNIILLEGLHAPSVPPVVVDHHFLSVDSSGSSSPSCVGL